jgi:hypothetical protein
MGILGKHVQETVGNAGSTKAATKATETLDEAMELLGLTADEIGGDDAYRSLDVAEQIKAFALALHSHGIDYSKGRPALGITGVAAPQNNGAIGALTSGNSSDNSNTEPSDAEKLGLELIKLSGNVDNAVKDIALMNRINKAGSQFGNFVVQTLEAIEGGHDRLVVAGSTLTLSSVVTIERRRQELDTEFTRLVTAAMNGVIIPGNTQHVAAEAIKEINELKTKASASVSDDSFLRAVEAASNIKPNKGETFEDYMTRVIVEVNKKAGVGDDTKFYNAIEKASKIKPNKAETLEEYIDRVYVKLIANANDPNGTGVTTLLDQIGTTLNVERKGKKNDEYKTVLLAEIASYQTDSENFRKLYNKLIEIANANHIAFPDNESPLYLAIRIAGYNRKVGSKINLPALPAV